MRKTKAILYALLAAAFYAVNVPFSKLLLVHVGPTSSHEPLCLALQVFGLRRWLASSSPIRATARMGSLSKLSRGFRSASPRRAAAWRGSHYSNASLLGNFEIVATTVIALAFFKEAASRRHWAAIGLITLSSILLSFEGTDSLRFSTGSLFVLLATVCWGFENNCTRMISSKSTYEIVILKGIFSGLGSLLIAVFKREPVPELRYIALALLLGFVAYGLSIFLYVRAQNTLGAAKTSAYYAVAPFIGVFLSFVFLRERLTWMYLAALAVMVVGVAFVVADTLVRHHVHPHQHILTHTHDGSTHTHTVTHSHGHDHYGALEKHGHRHSADELERELNLQARTEYNIEELNPRKNPYAGQLKK